MALYYFATRAYFWLFIGATLITVAYCNNINNRILYLYSKLAHHEEKRLLLEQTLLTTKDQLKCRVSETVRQEQTISKLQTENLTIREHNVQLEQDTEELKKIIDGSVFFYSRVIFTETWLHVYTRVALCWSNDKYNIY